MQLHKGFEPIARYFYTNFLSPFAFLTCSNRTKCLYKAKQITIDDDDDKSFLFQKHKHTESPALPIFGRVGQFYYSVYV